MEIKSLTTLLETFFDYRDEYFFSLSIDLLINKISNHLFMTKDDDADFIYSYIVNGFGEYGVSSCYGWIDDTTKYNVLYTIKLFIDTTSLDQYINFIDIKLLDNLMKKYSPV